MTSAIPLQRCLSNAKTLWRGIETFSNVPKNNIQFLTWIFAHAVRIFRRNKPASSKRFWAKTAKSQSFKNRLRKRWFGFCRPSPTTTTTNQLIYFSRLNDDPSRLNDTSGTQTHAQRPYPSSRKWWNPFSLLSPLSVITARTRPSL